MLSKTLKALRGNQIKNMTYTANRSFWGKNEAGSSDNQQPKRIAVTGACGNISYSVLFRLAAGEFLGKDQRIILHLVDVPGSEQKMQGVQAELHDCAFPLVDDIVYTSDLSQGFKDVDYAFMIGSKPRGPGMERADLLKDNGKIFVGLGKAMADHASRDCK